VDEKGELFGKAFEHFIFMEIAAHNSYNELDYLINFWRTKPGLEVDFILGGGEVAIRPARPWLFVMRGKKESMGRSE
jgi:predicted AAA+ superfamily ATPase